MSAWHCHLIWVPERECVAVDPKCFAKVIFAGMETVTWRPYEIRVRFQFDTHN